jgi:hypothetical protein
VQELFARGFGKMVAEFDGKLASAAGDKKALTRANVEAYLSEFGLDAELASHSHIKGLSGGQKVRILGALCGVVVVTVGGNHTSCVVTVIVSPRSSQHRGAAPLRLRCNSDRLERVPDVSVSAVA